MTFVLDNIRSAWNVGSVLRSSDALGARVILVGYTPLPIGKTKDLIKKTAIGAENHVPWEHFDMPQDVLNHYADGMHIGIEITEKSIDLLEFLSTKPALDIHNVFVWFGNEIHGISPDLCSQFSYTMHLPMHGMKESLNVANTVCTVGYLFEGLKY